LCNFTGDVEYFQKAMSYAWEQLEATPDVYPDRHVVLAKGRAVLSFVDYGKLRNRGHESVFYDLCDATETLQRNLRTLPICHPDRAKAWRFLNQILEDPLSLTTSSRKDSGRPIIRNVSPVHGEEMSTGPSSLPSAGASKELFSSKAPIHTTYFTPQTAPDSTYSDVNFS
jgi:hypothetical protein